MRLALISDIHGNAVALEAVLSDIRRRGADRIVILGDICFRGPEPKRALEMVRDLVHEHDALAIKGNTDEWTVRGIRPGEIPDPVRERMEREREWCASFLTKTELEWLEGLPHELLLPLGGDLVLHAFHATPDSLFDAVWPDASAEQIGSALLKDGQARIFAYGHVHFPYIRYVRGKAVLNTGSVGLPFDGLPQASYILLESDGRTHSAALVRVPYDVERAVRQFAIQDYPEAELMARVLREARSPFELG